MGKALLIIVLGASVVLAKQLWGSHEAGLRTATDQRDYQENVLAREIAASAFNVGMGELRSYGERLRNGVTEFNGPDGTGRSGTITGGKYAGGRYDVRAEYVTAHSARIIATGYYGRYLDDAGREQWRGKVTLHDQYRVFVLTARQTSVIDPSIIPGGAGHCSAIYYQAYLPSTPEGERPDPVLIYGPENGDRSGTQPWREIVATAGTQMNFLIGVDPNCSTREIEDVPDGPTCQQRAYALTHHLDLSRYNDDGTHRGAVGPDEYDFLHFALDVEAGALNQTEESIWSMVEQHAGNRNRWRIGWEDMHTTAWDNPRSKNPGQSLQATKRFGYDGRGWPQSDSRGFAAVREYSTRPDFEDVMLDVTALPVQSAAAQQRLAAAAADYAACGLPTPPEVTRYLPPTTPTTPTTPTAPTAPVSTDGAACTCQGRKKVAVMHRPPGNESNEHVICIDEHGWVNGHQPRHNDYIVCRGLDR